MKVGSKIVAIALILAGLALVNFLAGALSLRVDGTSDAIYSLSPGTRAMLGRITDPIRLELYYSKDAAGLPIAFKNYAARVQEMLRQYVRAAHGRITLRVVNPQPETPEEDRATAAGLTPQVAQQAVGEPFYFGLVAYQAEQQRKIPAFTPQREQFLEYDLSRLVYAVQQSDKRKLGLLSSLPLQGDGENARYLAMVGRQPQPGQYVVDEWSQSFDVVKVDPTAGELPAGLDLLAVVQPQNLSPKLQFSIDQFLLGGKPVFLAVDPLSYHALKQGGAQAMYGKGPELSSDLSTLLGAYGISFDPAKVVGDPSCATQVQAGGGAGAGLVRYPLWLSLTKDNFNAKALPAAQLNSALFVDAGSLVPKAGCPLTFTPVIETSAQAGEIEAEKVRYTDPESVAKELVPTGKRTLAALVTGKFKTAFPDGAPKLDDKAGAGPSKAAAAPTGPALRESTGTSTLFVVADTDWLFDEFGVRRFSFFGQNSVQPLNDNSALAANTMDLLGGSPDLISVRGKGTSLRPFTVVEHMEAEAQRKYQGKLDELEGRLADVQKKLAEIQGRKSEGNSLVATPEVAKAIEDFQKEQASLRGERRSIHRALRQDIDVLEDRLLTVNLVAGPLLVGIFGVWFRRSRRR